MVRWLLTLAGMRTSMVAFFALLTSGCFTQQLSVIAPKPNIVFTHNSGKSLLLRIQPTVPDRFTTHISEAFEPSVDGWRQTLANGFRSGFAGYFAPTPPKGPSDLRLEIERADLEWSFIGHLLVAHVVYRARLVDRDGHSIASAAGTAAAKSTWTPGAPMEPSVASSVETMYEELSDKLLRPIERPPQKDATPPPGSVEI